MFVSMAKMIVHIPYAGSLKDKRRVIKSIKDKLRQKFKVSAAETDLLNSVTHGEIGMVLASNSKKFGESVMEKAVNFVEDNFDIELVNHQVITEYF